MEHVPAADRLWVVLHPEVLDDATLRLCSCACVRHTPLADGRTVWDLLDDPRSRNAVEVAELYANGQATDDELAAAGYAARLCAWEAAGDAWASQIAIVRDVINRRTKELVGGEQ